MKENRQLISWFLAFDHVGRAMFGGEYLDRLSWRDTWLLEHFSFGNVYRGSDDAGPDYWAAQRQAKFKDWQDRHIAQWFEDNSLTQSRLGLGSIAIDKEAFLQAFKRRFPTTPINLDIPSETNQATEESTRRGRPRTHDWEGAIIEMVRIAATNPDGLPSKQSDLAQAIADWFVARTGNHPALSLINDRVRRAYVAVRGKS